MRSSKLFVTHPRNGSDEHGEVSYEWCLACVNGDAIFGQLILEEGGNLHSSGCGLRHADADVVQKQGGPLQPLMVHIPLGIFFSTGGSGVQKNCRSHDAQLLQCTLEQPSLCLSPEST